MNSRSERRRQRAAPSGSVPGNGDDFGAGEELRLLREDPDAHPVVHAWRAVVDDRRPARVELVKGTLRCPKGRAVYRLWRPDGGGTVIAKRCLRGPAASECIAYQEVLCRLPVSVPRCYGTLVDGEHGWLFLEEVVGERFAPTDPVQRACAARWLGQLHGASARLTGAGLPDRGPALFLAALQRMRRAITENRQNPVFDREAHAVLQAVLDCTGRLESSWDRVERACAAMPRTFVHGDFAPKNIYVRGAGAGRELCVIDWEHSGLGVPAVDLACCREGHRQVNLGSYSQLTGWTRQDIAEWSVVGSIFRQLVTMEWASRSLPFQWAEKPVGSLRIYLHDLERALARAGWARA